MDKYNSYKDSGVKWLGQIPSHWEAKRLASYFSERKVKVSDKDYMPLSVTKMGILPQLENVAKTDDGDNRKLVLAGDFVINSRSDRKGSSGVSDYDGSVSLINLVLQPRSGILPRFCNYYFKSYGFIEEFYRNGHGIVADLWTTRDDEMKMIKVAIPPLNEQESMVNYLDKATARIDEAISQQQSLIDLLNERKRIIIFNAVTKGLDLNVELRDSGIEWVGKMPSHWDIFKGKVVCRVQCGCPFDSKLFSLENGFPLIRIRDISSGKIETYFDGPYQEKYVVRKDDILVGMDGDFTVRWWDNVDGLLNQRCCRVFPNELISNRFLFYYLPIGLKIINDMTPATTVKHLSDKDIKNMPICVPPIKEQQKIVAYLDEQSSIIDVAIENANHLIALLYERKQIILNDVVTGKVKLL